MVWYILAGSVLVVWILVWFLWGMVLHYQAIHPPSREKWLTVYQERTVLELDFYKRYHLQDIVVTTKTGQQIKLHVFGKNTHSKWVVHHHGHQTGHEWGYKLVPWYVNHGYNVVLYDARGFGSGKSRGYCSFGIHEKEDLKTVANYLQQHFKPLVVGMHGDSLGGATVLQYASIYDHLNLVGFYVIDSGYQSFRQVLKTRFSRKLPFFYLLCWPFFMTGFGFAFWVRSRVSLKQAQASRSKITNLVHPLTWIHSKTDPVVNINEAQRVANWCQKSTASKCSFHYFERGDHTRLCFSSPAEFFKILEKAIVGKEKEQTN